MREDPFTKERQPDAKRRAAARTRAGRRHCSAVHFHQVLDDRQPESEAALCPGERLVGLPKPIEDKREEFRA